MAKSNKAVKKILIEMYGKRCMLCERKLSNNECTYHHIIPRSCGGLTTITNGAVLCENCQREIHTFKYKSKEYTNLTLKIYFNMQKYEKGVQ